MRVLKIVSLFIIPSQFLFFLQTLSQMLTAYISRLSAIADNKINCGPALTWMEVLMSLLIFNLHYT